MSNDRRVRATWIASLKRKPAAKGACPLAGLALLAAVMSCPSQVVAADNVQVVVSWTEVQTEYSPRQETWRPTREVRLTLRGGSQLSENAAITPTSGRGPARTTSGEGKFREALAGDMKTRATWQVGGPKSLVRTQNYRQHVTTIRVTVTSSNSCQAHVSFKLKPGFRDYFFISIVDRREMHVSSVSAENVACRIGMM